jgi:hypothetical protein
MTLAYLACKMNLCSYINSDDQLKISKQKSLKWFNIKKKKKIFSKMVLRNLQKTNTSLSVSKFEAFHVLIRVQIYYLKHLMLLLRQYILIQMVNFSYY